MSPQTSRRQTTRQQALQEKARTTVKELEQRPGAAAGPPAPQKLGPGSFHFAQPPALTAGATLVGPMEGQGPLAGAFDQVVQDELLGEASWEKAETALLEQAVQLVGAKAHIPLSDVDLLLGGDLLNQIVSASFAARGLDIPFYGLFNACATWTEALALAGVLLDGGYAGRVIAAVSSHNKTAERQYRFPTELGHQRPPTAQWTVTGAAAVILEREAGGPRLTAATAGRVVDAGVKNPFDMGSAMAPAAADTLLRHFRDTGRSPQDYDLILTGDLSGVGVPLCRQLLQAGGQTLDDQLQDCGLLIYDRQQQDVHAGASGTACSAAVFLARYLQELQTGKIQRALLVSTGALLSKTTYEQGETIPCIAHAVSVETEDAVQDSLQQLQQQASGQAGPPGTSEQPMEPDEGGGDA